MKPSVLVEEDRPFDCVILGAGPAGLTALTYLARFHRRVIALGGAGARPRVLLIDRTFNLPGYPDGISGAALLRRLREQAEEMDGPISDTVARRVEGEQGEFTVHLSEGSPLRARAVLLAMGVRDRRPDIPGIERHDGHFVRYCPVCDGYEFSGERLGILGHGPTVARHALFLRAFSDRIVVFLHGESPDSLGRYKAMLDRRGIAVYGPRVAGFLERGDCQDARYAGCGVVLEDGSEHPLAVLYSALGCDVNLDPIRHLDLRLDEEGYVVTDCNQQTSVPGIYAAGDVVSNINQISVAFGQAAIAAIRIHGWLDEE